AGRRAGAARRAAAVPLAGLSRGSRLPGAVGGSPSRPLTRPGEFGQTGTLTGKDAYTLVTSENPRRDIYDSDDRPQPAGPRRLARASRGRRDTATFLGLTATVRDAQPPGDHWPQHAGLPELGARRDTLHAAGSRRRRPDRDG